MKNSYLSPILTLMADNTARATREFSGLSLTQLNWKPHPETWSVGQCIDHLITSNATYFPTLQGIADGSYRMGTWAKLSPFSGMFGKMLLDMTGPEVKKKAKSPKAFVPTQGNVPGDIVKQFEQHQAKLIGLINATDKVAHADIKIPSPAAGFITYRLDACIRILANHELRHLNQASRLLAHPAFPK